MNRTNLIAAVAILLVAGVSARRRNDDLTFGEWFLKNLIPLLGGTVLGLVFIWCCCSIFAGRAEKKAQEQRRRRRQEQEEEELQIQVSLYNR